MREGERMTSANVVLVRDTLFQSMKVIERAWRMLRKRQHSLNIFIAPWSFPMERLDGYSLTVRAMSGEEFNISLGYAAHSGRLGSDNNRYRVIEGNIADSISRRGYRPPSQEDFATPKLAAEDLASKIKAFIIALEMGKK
jgi:hypothetical protein